MNANKFPSHWFVFLFWIALQSFGCNQTITSQPPGGPNSWSALADTAFISRDGLTAIAYFDTIYSMGGFHVDFSNIFQRCDPSNDTWSTPQTNGNLFKRSRHVSQLVNGKIYVIGGIDSNSGTGGLWRVVYTVQVFDPTTQTWTTLSTTGPFTPTYSSASAAMNGKIYVMGGFDSIDRPVRTVQIFDPSSNTWSTPVMSGPYPSLFGSQACVVGNRIYLFGGADSASNYITAMYALDPSSNTWTQIPTTGTFVGRDEFTASAIGTKIYAACGRSFNGDIPLQIFDTQTNTWSTPSTAGRAPQGISVASVAIGGKFYVLGAYPAFVVYTP